MIDQSLEKISKVSGTIPENVLTEVFILTPVQVPDYSLRGIGNFVPGRQYTVKHIQVITSMAESSRTPTRR